MTTSKKRAVDGATRSGQIEAGELKEAMGRFATGVAVVTGFEDGVPVGLTCQSVISLSLDPPLLALAPAKTSTSWPRLVCGGVFCVNILSQDQEDLCRQFARSGGEKFSGVAWHEGQMGAPVIAECLASVECQLEMIHDAGDHELVIGRVVAVTIRHGEPLVFYQSSFGRWSSTLDFG